MLVRGHNLAVWRYADSGQTKCCPEQHWNKQDLYDYYCPHRNQTLDLSGQYNPAWFMLEKTPATIQFIDDYVEGVSDFHLVSDEPSQLPNIPGFIENRHDQSIFSLLVKCRYLENGIDRFNLNSSLPTSSKKNRIRMLSITMQKTASRGATKNTNNGLWTMLSLVVFYSLI
jgi:hypothetical protein